jgi:hypothetical protein
MIFFVVGMAFNLEGSNQGGPLRSFLCNDFAKNTSLVICLVKLDRFVKTHLLRLFLGLSHMIG